jgi:adenine-specific DNA-methyltransferase
MPKKKTTDGVQAASYRHATETRTNIPPARIAAEGTVPKVGKVRYHYSPHLPPNIRHDSSGTADRLAYLIEEAGSRVLTASEQQQLAEGLRCHQPWLEWAGKREQHQNGFFDVDPVALHIHERVSTQAMLRALAREDIQRDLFADPQQPYSKAVQFYRHPMNWANRLILGDSLQVMTSLAEREQLAGKVQMIYVDPPYGINYSSNFQPEIARVKVKEKDSDLIREPEAVKAFRDTWALGSHSYIQYLDGRLRAAKKLLHDSGSIFVQIGDDQCHRVRQILDEIFGPENFVAQINFRSMMPLASGDIESVYDYVLWYAVNKRQMKYRNLFVRKDIGDESEFSFREAKDGRYDLRSQDKDWNPNATGVFKRSNLSSSGYTESCTFNIDFEGHVYPPVQGKSWRTTPAGVSRLIAANRILKLGKKLYFKLYVRDFTHRPLVNSWHDTIPFDRKLYVVRTTTTVIERCMLMTTDPGDLVLDPTCGSGTTAYVAEQWGRRWITMDTSRVAVSIARQRLLTAGFRFYRTKGAGSTDEDPANGFVYKKVPHITLKSIAQNVDLDPIFERHTPKLAHCLRDLNEALARTNSDVRKRLSVKLANKQRVEGKKSITEADRRRWQLPTLGWRDWEVPFDVDADWPKELQEALIAYRAAWQAKVAEVDASIAANAEPEDLVDDPEVVNGVTRVSGPFTV